MYNTGVQHPLLMFHKSIEIFTYKTFVGGVSCILFFVVILLVSNASIRIQICLIFFNFKLKDRQNGIFSMFSHFQT